MKYKISVILPIYNAEETLDKAIQSIINQSIGFKNIELILIDDASKDNSKQIIKSYCEKYDNIIPYYSENNHGYPSFGRNIGLEKATSDFVMFIDNDDKYDKEICEKLYDTIINENADIACCNKVSVDSIGNIEQKISYINGIEKDDKVIINNDDILFFDSITIWNKIYRKDIIKDNNLKFLENTIGDDFGFTMDYYLNSKKLVYLKNYNGYYWNINSKSLSHDITEKYMLEFIDVFLYTYSQIKNKNKEKYSNKIFESHITDRITECSYLKLDYNSKKRILYKIYDFEKKINFDGMLSAKWAKFINKFIITKHFTITILLLKTVDFLRSITILRKLNRKL